MPTPSAERRGSAHRGGVAVEFALVAPLLVLALTAVVDLGFAGYESMQTQAAAEAGALYAAKHGWDAAAIEAAVLGATGAEGLTATPAPTQFCGCPAAGGLAPVACNDTCPGGLAPAQYVRVNAQLTHKTLLAYPGLPSPLTFTGQAVVRVQ